MTEPSRPASRGAAGRCPLVGRGGPGNGNPGAVLGPRGAGYTVDMKPFLTERFEDALVYATRLHATQCRKGTKTPYVAPLLAVASLALEHGADEDEAVAALLHDAVED